MATDYIMGHSPDSDDMLAVYRERMSNGALVKVVKYIRRWVGLAKVEDKAKDKAKAKVEAKSKVEASAKVFPKDEALP